MGFVTVLRKNSIYIIAVFVLFGSFLYQHQFLSFIQILQTQFFANSDNSDVIVLSQEQLAQFNGVDKDKLYLALLGNVYDVTKGNKHYKRGAPYNYFIGKDGSKAFITGNFKDESHNNDDILDLSCSDILNLLKWEDTLKKKYKLVGVLYGRFYNERGKATQYTQQLQTQIEECYAEIQRDEDRKRKYPPCNVEWNVDSGSRVWCTKISGGISRGWVGVPRQLYTPGEEKPYCVCVNLHKDNSAVLLKEYDNCHKTSESCSIGNNI